MNHFELSFRAALQNESFARTAVAAFVATINPTMDELMEVKTLVSEAVSNAILHGYKMDASRDVYIKGTMRDREFELIIQDYGVGMELKPIPVEPKYSSSGEEEHSGMGIPIMKSLATTFIIQSKIGLGTKVIMTKVFVPMQEEVL